MANDKHWEAAGSVVPIGGPLPVRVKVLPHGEGLELPSYGTPDAVGLDLRAAVEPTFPPIILYPGRMHKIPTGLCFAIPPGYAGLVLSRSGLAAKHQVAVTNAPGLVDPDYRGEVFLLLENRGRERFEYRRGDRLGQLLIVPAPRIELQVAADLDDTARGEGGFGSTGVSS
jgi:dUTP pyrophosphatase